MFARKSLERNILGLNELFDFGEAKTTDVRILWPARLLLQVAIPNNPGYVFSN